MTAGSAIAPRPQAVAPSPDETPGQSAPSAGQPHRQRKPLTLLNKASTLAFTLLALTLIPAHHASAQIFEFNNPTLTYTITEDASPNTVTNARSLELGAAGNTRNGAFTEQNTAGMYGTFVLVRSVGQTRSAQITYTLDNDNTDVDALNNGETLTETFTVEANQTSGSAGQLGAQSATITINIRGVSDDPTMIVAPVSDPDALTGEVLEDSGRNASDEVLVTRGTVTDLPLLVVTDMPTTYGTFTTIAENAFGARSNLWFYTLDNTNPAVDALNDGETLTDTFTLTAADDGDTPATAVVTITIRGATDPNRIPTFGAATIAPQRYTPDTAVSVTLPAATGGNGALTYAITETLPVGLTFTAATRVLDGTPTTLQTAIAYTYTVTDADANQAATDADTLPFTITIADDPPDIVFAGGPRMTVDEGAMVTLDATNTRDPEGPQTATGQVQTGLTFLWTQTGGETITLTPGDTDATGRARSMNERTTFTAPTKRATLNFDLTVTDTTGQTATDTLTVQVGRNTSERTLEKTLAAFGRAFATGTVGVFEDYLSTPAGRTNTSHFTLGGHKFELATNTPSAAVGTGRDLSALTHLNRSGNPVQTLPAQPDCRAQGCARGAGNRSFPAPHRGARGVSPPQTRVTRTTMSAKDLLMKSAFHFNLNDDATATSGWSLWARATTTNFNGKPEDDFDLNGDVTSAYLGTDYRTPNGTRLGLAISETSGNVDYDDATDEAQGDMEADLTSILPYIQWQPNDTTTAWAMLGYGEGDAELATDGDDQTTEVDIDMQMIALGISGDLTTYKRSEWSWKASAFAVELESDADEATDLPAVTADSQRLRAAIQGRVPGEITADGAQFTPNWELGLRWDDGDAEQGGGADVGLGFNYTNPVNGLSVQGKTSFLVAHEAEDYEEWEASLQARLDSGVQGRGITFTLEPGWTADGRSQKMGMDFSNALGKWTKRGLRLELTGERTEKDDDNIGHNIRLAGSLHF